MAKRKPNKKQEEIIIMSTEQFTELRNNIEKLLDNYSASNSMYVQSKFNELGLSLNRITNENQYKQAVNMLNTLILKQDAAELLSSEQIEDVTE